MSTSKMQETTSVAEYTLPLWEDTAPQALGSGELHVPQLNVHLAPTGLANGCAVIINPGGGYRSLASDHEGLQVARWLNQRGITAFVLRYRVGPNYSTSVSLLDGQRAVRLIRSRAATFNIDVDRWGFPQAGIWRSLWQLPGMRAICMRWILLTNTVAELTLRSLSMR